MHEGHRELAHLLAAPHALGGGDRVEEGTEQRGFACSGLPAHDDRGIACHHEAKELRCRCAERPEFDEAAKTLSTKAEAANGCREGLGDRWRNGGEPRRAVEHPGLHDRGRRVEPAIGRGEEAIDDVPSFRP